MSHNKKLRDLGYFSPTEWHSLRFNTSITNVRSIHAAWSDNHGLACDSKCLPILTPLSLRQTAHDESQYICHTFKGFIQAAHTIKSLTVYSDKFSIHMQPLWWLVLQQKITQQYNYYLSPGNAGSEQCHWFLRCQWVQEKMKGSAHKPLLKTQCGNKAQPDGF